MTESDKQLAYALAKLESFNRSSGTNKNERNSGTNGTNGTIGTIGTMFKVHRANDDIKTSALRPARKRFFYNLITEGENTIIVGSTGIGKTVFSMQMAEAMAKMGLTVLYFDLELSDKQFEERYSHTETITTGEGEYIQKITHCSDPYIFPDNFLRATFNEDLDVPDGKKYEDCFMESLESCIIEYSPQVVIIDNMTKLVPADTDKAATAKPMMDNLCRLKNRYEVTTVLLEHTRKTDRHTPLELNQMQGSKMKSNLIDAVIGIGVSSQDEGLRYVKELKTRSKQKDYGDDNVLLFEICKGTNKLFMEPKGTASESDHLQEMSRDDKEHIKEEAKRLYAGGASYAEVAQMLHCSKTSAFRYVQDC